jgi:hypothetical protein
MSENDLVYYHMIWCDTILIELLVLLYCVCPRIRVRLAELILW